MNIEPKHIILFSALLLLLINRVFQRKPFFEKHGNLVRIVVFLMLIAALVTEFIKTKSYMIFIVAALGVLAIVWIIYDMRRKSTDDITNSDDETENTN